MTIKLRFALLLSLLLGGFLLAVAVLRGLERAEMHRMLGAERQTRGQFLNHWIDLTSRALPQFAADTAQSDELGALFAPATAAAARQKLAARLAAAGVNALWILRPDASVVLQAGASPADAALAPPLEPDDFAALVGQTPNPRFFVDLPREGLFEVCIRRLQPARPDNAEWLIAARRWDETQLRALESLTEARVSLRGAHENVQAPADEDRIELLRPLNDWRGHAIRTLRVEARATEVGNAIQADWRQVQVFVAFGLLVIAAMALALHQWVASPLNRIGASLATGNPTLVAGLADQKSELGRVAALVVASFAHQQALQREIEQRTRAQQALERSEIALRQNLEERARLGRDLHDGVIQSLYAAGMGLAGIRMQLRPEQVEAAARLEQTRAALNETIHDVRNFIIGLEPEALKLQTFAQAVAAMLEVMRGLRAFRSTTDIDEVLATRLTLAQRVHALQITREAVSNALRHGHAGAIHVALRPHGDFVEFEVVDDGTGFDAVATMARGKGGLANFAQRARELGAELDVHSEPGRGTRVRLVFSLLIL
jgi:signal transduction histidine kinase